MGHTGSDGRPFTPQEQERLQQALLSVTRQVAASPPSMLSEAELQAWHATLCAGIEAMQPGRYRQAEITFGSFLGTAPRLIPREMAALLKQHHERLSSLEERQQAGEDLAQAVLHHATWLHAELIRIHPYWDGNGRLARLVQAWLCWRFDQPVPIYTNRARYLAALNRYHYTRDFTLLLQLSQESQRRPG